MDLHSEILSKRYSDDSTNEGLQFFTVLNIFPTSHNLSDARRWFACFSQVNKMCSVDELTILRV